MSLIKHQKDFWAGVLYIAFGAAAIVIALDYPLGTANRMGPGYFPRGLGILMIVLGRILVLRSFKLPGRADRASRRSSRLLIVLGSVIVFGLAAPKLGLVVATILLILVSSTASHEFRWKEAIIASVVLAAFTVAAFS